MGKWVSATRVGMSFYQRVVARVRCESHANITLPTVNRLRFVLEIIPGSHTWRNGGVDLQAQAQKTRSSL